MTSANCILWALLALTALYFVFSFLFSGDQTEEDIEEERARIAAEDDEFMARVDPVDR